MTRTRSIRVPLGLGANPHTLFLALLAQERLPLPEPEVQFAPPRRWRFDYAWRDAKVALEVDGGIWTQGRHTRAAGWLKDSQKLNTAAALGWRLLRVTPYQLCLPSTVDFIRRALQPTPR